MADDDLYCSNHCDRSIDATSSILSSTENTKHQTKEALSQPTTIHKVEKELYFFHKEPCKKLNFHKEQELVST